MGEDIANDCPSLEKVKLNSDGVLHPRDVAPDRFLHSDVRPDHDSAAFFDVLHRPSELQVLYIPIFLAYLERAPSKSDDLHKYPYPACLDSRSLMSVVYHRGTNPACLGSQ
jgi:hypothetical protein